MGQVKKKILILGSKGMAGHVIYHYLKTLNQYQISDVSRNNAHFISTYTIVDITEFNSLTHVLETEKPDFVINCIGVLIKEAETFPDRAILINSYLPHYLARKGKELGFRLIHIGTDCVFSGKKGNYVESDIQDGTGSYAQSKSLGEVYYGNNLTIRTSLIGPELKVNGVGLFHWFMHQSGHINGYKNAIWTGVTTIELAHAIHVVIQDEVTGLIHLVNNEVISKYDLVVLFKDVFDCDHISVDPFDTYVVNKSLINTKGAIIHSSYKTMIIEMREWMLQNKSLYPNYQ